MINYPRFASSASLRIGLVFIVAFLIESHAMSFEGGEEPSFSTEQISKLVAKCQKSLENRDEGETRGELFSVSQTGRLDRLSWFRFVRKLEQFRFEYHDDDGFEIVIVGDGLNCTEYFSIEGTVNKKLKTKLTLGANAGSTLGTSSLIGRILLPGMDRRIWKKAIAESAFTGIQTTLGRKNAVFRTVITGRPVSIFVDTTSGEIQGIEKQMTHQKFLYRLKHNYPSAVSNLEFVLSEDR